MKFKFLEHSKFLWWFAGEDPYILSECPKKIRVKFSVMGLIVITILLITGISFTYGVYELLESYYFGFAIGVYFAFVILFLYLFILYTLTKNVLPKKSVSKIGRIASYVIRIGFLVFLGVIVSQPIEYSLFSNKVDTLLNDNIIKEIEIRNQILNKEYVYKLKESQNLNLSQDLLAEEVANFQWDKTSRLENFINYQYSRNFFIRKMILMDTSSETWYIWIFSGLFVFIFISPILIKSRISIDSGYYRNKKRIQSKLVLENHYTFVEQYNSILKRNYEALNLTWQTTYQDPPFNTIKINDLELQSDSEFSKWLLNENN
ncbi:DUF4407 domain-containing protein [Psychroserpens sp. Hel_I_66]|uniref:DUF4407 domain-containing protein n=1 Tax=Psychroserpens sp. Hel_I_66 TaxID=1250004 RepID=UPI000645F0F7|nr:DUF4407 domain-containing protein [Psychroserpens sp. Hel_I_66]